MEFVREPWVEYMGLAQRQEIAARGTEIAESGQSIGLQCRLRTAVPIRDETAKKEIVRGKTMIDASGKLIQSALARRAAQKPVGGISVRHQGEQLLNDGVGHRDAICRRRDLGVQSRDFTALAPFVA